MRLKLIDCPRLNDQEVQLVYLCYLETYLHRPCNSNFDKFYGSGNEIHIRDFVFGLRSVNLSKFATDEKCFSDVNENIDWYSVNKRIKGKIITRLVDSLKWEALSLHSDQIIIFVP